MLNDSVLLNDWHVVAYAPTLQEGKPVGVRLLLDLQAELHLRSDRTAIAYRKWLKELGLTFGIA
jgi:hypothetical protein